MQISLLIYLFIAIIFVLIILYLIKISKNSGGNPSPIPCVGPGCDPNKNINCSVLDVNTIRHCEKDEDCYRCADNGGNMSCQTTPDYAIDLPQSNCLPPNYIYNSDTSTCHLAPNQNICLPFDLNSDFECNEYTGIKILTKPGLNLPYNWKCLCRDNTKFTNNNEIGTDCTDIKLCSMLGTTNENSKNGNYLVRTGTETYPQPTYWNSKSKWNPLPPSFDGGEGACKCNSQSYADQNNLRCITGTCYPGTPTTNGKDCDCQHPYIKCSDINYRNDYVFGKYSLGLCDDPSCVPDPCIISSDDYSSQYDSGTNTCKCKGENTIAISSDQVPTGQKCQNVCSNNGPCGSGTSKRGTCYAETSDAHDKTTYWHFVTDETARCEIQHIESGRYLAIDNDGRLINDTAGSLFYIVPFCSGITANPNGSCKSPNGALGVKSLITNDKYMFKDVKSGKYIGLNTKTGIIELITNPIDYIQWSFIQSGSSTTVGAIMYPINNYIIPDKKFNEYVNNLVSTTKWQNSARCKDCIEPAQQDVSSGLCNEKPLLPPNSKCDADEDCRSGHCKHCGFWEFWCSSGCD
jgi:hypothetical protein